MYKWEPCVGPSPEVIERMRARFPMPKEPTGEAWFMGEKRYFFEWLTETPVAEADSFSEDALLHENLFHAPDILFDRLSKTDAG